MEAGDQHIRTKNVNAAKGTLIYGYCFNDFILTNHNNQRYLRSMLLIVHLDSF